jgi:hypothetical protein
MLAELEKKQTGDDFVILRSGAPSDNRIGIYARGGCHLNALFACAPLIQPVLKGACCIYHDGDAPRCRTDMELQTLQGLPPEWTGPVSEKLRLVPDYFQPRLFEGTFSVPGANGPEVFPKTVTVLHIGMDSGGRTLYRHRQHGFLVDPGGSWLQSMDSVLQDLNVLSWFRQNFESIGMISVDEFVKNLRQIITTLRARMDTRILVFNTLAVEPGSLTHNYQLIRFQQNLRWRQFNIALWELSREMDFAVVDIDRVLKLVGIKTQTGYAHFLPRQNLFIGHEAFGIMRDLGVFD